FFVLSDSLCLAGQHLPEDARRGSLALADARVLCLSEFPYLRTPERLEQLRSGDAGDLGLSSVAVHQDPLEPGLVVVPPDVVVTSAVGLAAVRQQGRGVADHGLVLGAGTSQAASLALDGAELLGQVCLLLPGDGPRHAALEGFLRPLLPFSLDGL